MFGFGSYQSGGVGTEIGGGGAVARQSERMIAGRARVCLRVLFMFWAKRRMRFCVTRLAANGGVGVGMGRWGGEGGRR